MVVDLEDIDAQQRYNKHHNQPPKGVATNRPENLTQDIVWNDPIIKCFLYSYIPVFIIILI